MACSKVKYGFFNLIDQETTDIIASSENAFFPASNIADARSTKVYRSATGTLTANVVFDFKTTEEVDFLAVRPNLETGFGFIGDLTIEANFVNEWSSPPYSTTLSVNSEHGLGSKLLDSDESYRFWRVSGTGSSYFEISGMYIGKAFVPGKNVSMQWSYQNVDLSKRSENVEGQVFIDKYGSRKEIQQSIKLLTKEEMALIDASLNYIGENKPFWMVMDDLELFSMDKERFAGVFYLSNTPRFTNIAFGLYNTSLTMREAK